MLAEQGKVGDHQHREHEGQDDIGQGVKGKAGMWDDAVKHEIKQIEHHHKQHRKPDVF